MVEWITVKIDHYWGLFLQLDPVTSILLFLVYGIVFEYLYGKSIYAYKDYRRFQAANLGVVLFTISLWGISEAITDNIMYAVPIIAGSWIGTVIQVTIEKRNHDREGGASA